MRVSILAVSVVTATYSYGGFASSEPQQVSPGPIEHVLVTVPIHRSEAETALPVAVLSGDELHDQMASSIGETLSLTPGIASASFGPGVGQPVIRGQQGARVMVLQNSTGSADASTSSGDHAVAVEPILADSIEVLRGPATLLYGGGAIGGVVNVIDNRIPVEAPERTRGKLELRHATVNDESSGVARIETGSQQFALHADATVRSSNNLDIPGRTALHEEDEATVGYIPNSDTEVQAVTLGGSYLFERGFIGIAVSDLQNEYGIPPGAHEHDPLAPEEEEVRIDAQQTRVDIRGDFHFQGTGFESLRWFLTDTDYQHDELEGAEVGTRWRKDSREGRLELMHRPVAGWHGVVGLQVTDFSLAAVGDESFIPETDVSRYGIFIVEDYHWRSWIFELGGRWDYDTLSPESAPEQSFNNTSLAASALWEFRPDWRLGVALSHSERAPVIEELYSNTGNVAGSYVEHVASGAIELGDDDLSSERSRNIDLTLSYQTATIDAFVTLFYNDFADFIYLANTGTQQVDTDILAYRQAGAEFSGAEFAVSTELGSWLGGQWQLRWSGDWVQGQLDSGEDLPRLPPGRLGSRLSYRWGDVSSYVAVIRAAKQDKPGAFEEPTAAYTRWDVGVDYSLATAADRELLLFLKCRNLGDEEIRYASSPLREVAPAGGRSIESGIRWVF